MNLYKVVYILNNRLNVSEIINITHININDLNLGQQHMINIEKYGFCWLEFDKVYKTTLIDIELVKTNIDYNDYPYFLSKILSTIRNKKINELI